MDLTALASRALVPLLLLAPAGAPAQQPSRPASPYGDMFTPWNGTNQDSLRAEAEARQRAAETAQTAVPAVAEHNAQVALGERVAEAVRRGDCAEGERIARAAGDFPLVQAVRDYCRTRS